MIKIGHSSVVMSTLQAARLQPTITVQSPHADPTSLVLSGSRSRGRPTRDAAPQIERRPPDSAARVSLDDGLDLLTPPVWMSARGKADIKSTNATGTTRRPSEGLAVSAFEPKFHPCDRDKPSWEPALSFRLPMEEAMACGSSSRACRLSRNPPSATDDLTALIPARCSRIWGRATVLVERP